MTKKRRSRGVFRAYLAILGGASLVALIGALFAVTAVSESRAASATAPANTAEPSVSGTLRVGQVLRTTRGTWTGTEPITYSYRWYRCPAQSKGDASDCRRITNANDSTYVLRQADAGFKIRSMVIARNDDGQAAAASNPTGFVAAARPTNTTEPSISGSAVVGNRLQANRGNWIGDQPITYSYGWLRCSSEGSNCSEIPGADDTQYEVRDSDAGHRLKVRVTARNDRGSTSEVSNATAVVTDTGPATGVLDASVLRAAGDRLVVAQVRFSPNPVTSSTAPINVRVQVTARGGRPVSGARVFMRATPRVVEGQTVPTGADGWASLTLVPNRLFPQPRNGYNVQFFVKAFRPSDPALGGIAGYRLVQVRLANGS